MKPGGLLVARWAPRRPSSVLSGSGSWRFFYTIKEAVEHGEIWFVNRPDGTLVDFTFEDRWVSPFWPHEDVGRLACRNMGVPGEINPMPLDYWIDDELDKNCRADDCLVGVMSLRRRHRISRPLTKCSRYWPSTSKILRDIGIGIFPNDRFFTTQNLKAGPKGRLP